MSFYSLLVNTCTVITRVPDKWGTTTEVATAGVPCRIEYGNKVVRSSKGEEVLSTARVFFKPDAPVDENKLLLFDGREHGIQRLDRPQDRRRVHHLEAWVD